MRNIKLTISYDGSRFKGWQLQKNDWTVQAELEKAIEKTFGKHHRVHAAGRTDSGVHAKGQVANFKTSSKILLKKIPAAINAALKDDVVIKKAEEVKDDFHSRFSVKSKVYKYYIRSARIPDPFEEKYSWRVPYKLNVKLMAKEASVLKGKHDFKAFQASDKREGTSVRKVSRISVKKKGSLIMVSVEGNGFLYNMVRNIAGTLVDIGRGKLPEGSMKKILRGKDRRLAGPTAPAKGLFLEKISY